MNLRLNLFLSSLQHAIDNRPKGSLLSVPALLGSLELWPIQDDLNKMRLAKALQKMVENNVLDNIRLCTRDKIRYAVYEIV